MTITSGFVLLSIQPEHAERIYSGQKRAELRKSFTTKARIVFIYETTPVSAITGAFLIENAERTNVEDAIRIAENHGVPRDRSKEYYGDRETGWIITISSAIKFGKPIPLRDLRAKDHYFSPPQSFLYLNKYEGLTQDLLVIFRLNFENTITLRELTAANRPAITSLIRSEIGANYENIDDDFVQQVLDEGVGSESAFSTIKKNVMEFVCGQSLVGFTVITVKQHGAWKTGPTILLPDFRGILFGQELRRAIEIYCKDEGARAIYCTCSTSQPTVVSYLLNSGMQLQARLKQHLSRDRDEFVFSKNLSDLPTVPQKKIRTLPLALPDRIVRIYSFNKEVKIVIRFFMAQMNKWYFSPIKEFSDSLFTSMRSFESGERAYSAKGRAIYCCFDANNRTCAALLMTPKRSKMVKMNLVSVTKDHSLIERVISMALNDFSQYRRAYISIPTTEPIAIEALSNISFSFEGILNSPFYPGVDHACFGKLLLK